MLSHMGCVVPRTDCGRRPTLIVKHVRGKVTGQYWFVRLLTGMITEPQRREPQARHSRWKSRAPCPPLSIVIESSFGNTGLAHIGAGVRGPSNHGEVQCRKSRSRERLRPQTT